MTARITPYHAGGKITDRIDEILIERPAVVHIELTSQASAIMLIGEQRFWIEARRGHLFIRKEA